MPAGVEVLVEDGFATIDFVDPKLRGVGVAALLEHTPPEFIETLTRTGPRRLYRVPEGNAREAGLVDKASVVDALEAPDTSSAGDPFGAVPPEFPSTRDLHAQTVRSGTYASEYTQGGLLDEVVQLDPVSDEDTPSDEWSRAALNEYAANHGVQDADKLPNKAAVLDALKA